MKTVILFFIMAISWVSFASVPPMDVMTSTSSAEEILTLPEVLRKQAVDGKAEQYYPQMQSIAFSNKKSVEMRWKALTMMAFLRKENAVTDLKRALQSSDWFMRNAAMLALNSISVNEGRVAAEQLIGDKALVVRSAAVAVLGPIMDSKIRDLFWREIDAKYNFRQNQSLWVREQMLGYLADSPSLSEKPIFLELSKSSPPAMKTLATNALKKLK